MTIDGRNTPVGGRPSWRRCSTRSWQQLPGHGCCSLPVTTSGPPRPTPGSSMTCRPSTWRTPGGWTPPAAATTSSTTGSRASCSTSTGRTSRSWPRTSIEDATGRAARRGSKPSKVFTVNGTKVGVIGAELEETPELVSAGATEGLQFLDEAESIDAESQRLKDLGVMVQVVVIHQGAALGQNAVDGTAAGAVGGPDRRHRRPAPGHHGGPRAGRAHPPDRQYQRGPHPVAEGLNAGASYSVAQLMVRDGDVAWAATATRVAKNLGVAKRADVQAIVDEANAQTAVLRNQVIGPSSSTSSAPRPACSSRRWATWWPMRCA